MQFKEHKETFTSGITFGESAGQIVFPNHESLRSSDFEAHCSKSTDMAVYIISRIFSSWTLIVITVIKVVLTYSLLFRRFDFVLYLCI